MKKLLVTACFLIPALALVTLGAQEPNKPERKVVKRTVIVAQDTTPFKAETSQRVRLMGEGIAGSTIVAEVDGPARIVAENSIMTVKGGSVLVGMTMVEFEIRPMRQGTVKVKITSTPPQPNAEPTIKNYEFEVD